MNDGKKRRSSAELIPLIFSAVLLDIIPIHYCHNLYSVMYRNIPVYEDKKIHKKFA